MPITKSTPLATIIDDFVNSDNPKFTGKSKEERIRMAKGAFYGMQKESVDEAMKTPAEWKAEREKAHPGWNKHETEDFQNRGNNYPKSNVPDSIEHQNHGMVFTFKNTDEKTAAAFAKAHMAKHKLKHGKIITHQDGDYHNDWVQAHVHHPEVKESLEGLDESALFANHEGKLLPLHQHTDPAGSIDYHSHMIEYSRPRGSKPSYLDKKEMYHWKDEKTALIKALKTRSTTTNESVELDEAKLTKANSDANDKEWAEIEKHWGSKIPEGNPALDQRARQSWEASKKPGYDASKTFRESVNLIDSITEGDMKKHKNMDELIKYQKALKPHGFKYYHNEISGDNWFKHKSNKPVVVNINSLKWRHGTEEGNSIDSLHSHLGSQKNESLELIDAISEGDTIKSAEKFSSALMSRVFSLIEERRQELACNIFEAKSEVHPSDIDVHMIKPEQKDHDRAEGLRYQSKTFKGNNDPFSGQASKMAKSIDDPHKLVRRTKAVAQKYGTNGYFKEHNPPGHSYDPDANAFGHFANRMKEMGFSHEQVKHAAFPKSQNESVLHGHPYHDKTTAELEYIKRDAAEAARNMKGHDPKAEAKYLDQINDASTILYARQKHGSNQK